MADDQIPNCDYVAQSYDFKTQFILRMIVLGAALFSSFFILIACLCSRKMKYWPFRLLALQTFSECIDLSGAIVLSNQSKCHPVACGFVGYIMHSSWLTSFLCSFLMVYVYYLTINFSDRLEWWKKNLQGLKLLFLLQVIPLIILVVPLLLGYFGPTGWKLNDTQNGDEDRFIVFCGYSRNENNFSAPHNYHDENLLFIFIYVLTFLLPILILFGIAWYLSCKARHKIKKIENSGLENEELKFIKGIQSFPRIYAFFWAINSILRILDIIYPDWSPNDNKIWYFLYVFSNLMHEIHMVIILYLFYKEFSKILNLYRIWLNAFCYCRRYKVEYLEISITESSLVIQQQLKVERTN